MCIPAYLDLEPVYNSQLNVDMSLWRHMLVCVCGRMEPLCVQYRTHNPFLGVVVQRLAHYVPQLQVTPMVAGPMRM